MRKKASKAPGTGWTDHKQGVQISVQEPTAKLGPTGQPKEPDLQPDQETNPRRVTQDRQGSASPDQMNAS